MRIRILVTGADNVHDELVSLREWLAAEDEFRGQVEFAGKPIDAGQLGVLADTLTVAVSGGGALTVLAGSVAVWLRHRRSALQVRIVNPDGSYQEITANGPAADILAAKVDPPRQD